MSNFKFCTKFFNEKQRYKILNSFTSNENGDCIADSVQPEDDDLADALEDSDGISEIQTGLSLPAGATLAETTPTETEVSAVTSGETAGSCPLNEDGSLGQCTCNEGFSEDDQGNCVRDEPEVEGRVQTIFVKNFWSEIEKLVKQNKNQNLVKTLEKILDF